MVGYLGLNPGRGRLFYSNGQSINHELCIRIIAPCKSH